MSRWLAEVVLRVCISAEKMNVDMNFHRYLLTWSSLLPFETSIGKLWYLGVAFIGTEFPSVSGYLDIFPLAKLLVNVNDAFSFLRINPFVGRRTVSHSHPVRSSVAKQIGGLIAAIVVRWNQLQKVTSNVLFRISWRQCTRKTLVPVLVHCCCKRSESRLLSVARVVLLKKHKLVRPFCLTFWVSRN